MLLGAVVHGADEPRRWRHEGLLLDNRDLSALRQRIGEEPWKSAREHLQEACGTGPSQTRLLATALRYAVEANPDDEKSLVEALRAAETPRSDPKSRTEAARHAVHRAIVFECVRGSRLWNESKREEFLKQLFEAERPWLAEESRADGIERAWTGAARMAVAVALEDDAMYRLGEKDYLDVLDSAFRDDGAPKETLSIRDRVELASAMLVMAETANHHSDLFWGKDLYHIYFGHKNLMRVCSHLFESIGDAGGTSVEHWGWLELAAKTFGEPAWLKRLESLRPIFDPWTGGAGTLTHALLPPTELPDFGVAPDGFRWLYNREDTAGWQLSSRWYDINQDDFYVEDGVIHTLGGRDHWLMTDRMYENFILRLEYRIGPGSNSGIMVWAPIPGRPSKTGFEIQLLDDAGKPPSDDCSGSLYKVVAPLANAQKAAGEWNRIEVRCDNPSLIVVLNGQTVQDVNLEELEALQGRRRRGYIGLQDHSHKVAFRNVRMKLLD